MNNKKEQNFIFDKNERERKSEMINKKSYETRCKNNNRRKLAKFSRLIEGSIETTTNSITLTIAIWCIISLCCRFSFRNFQFQMYAFITNVLQPTLIENKTYQVTC